MRDSGPDSGKIHVKSKVKIIVSRHTHIYIRDAIIQITVIFYAVILLYVCKDIQNISFIKIINSCSTLILLHLYHSRLNM